MDRRAICFIETCLEDVGDAKLSRDSDVFLRGTQRHVFRLEYVDAAKQHKGIGVADIDCGGDGNGRHGEFSWSVPHILALPSARNRALENGRAVSRAMKV